MHRATTWRRLLLATTLLPVAAAAASTVDDLAQRPSWTAPHPAEIRQQLESWPPLAAAEPAARQVPGIDLGG